MKLSLMNLNADNMIIRLEISRRKKSLSQIMPIIHQIHLPIEDTALVTARVTRVDNRMHKSPVLINQCSEILRLSSMVKHNTKIIQKLKMLILL